jgi:hypothetical protein
MLLQKKLQLLIGSVFWIWGSHCSDYEQSCLLVYNAGSLSDSQPTFRRNISPTSVGSNSKSSKKPAWGTQQVFKETDKKFAWQLSTRIPNHAEELRNKRNFSIYIAYASCKERLRFEETHSEGWRATQILTKMIVRILITFHSHLLIGILLSQIIMPRTRTK